jgi:hypothetical protein
MLQTQFVLSRNYKLVDLKPAYGELFQEYLQGYDFWGYTDLDVLYGDLSRFFTDPILNSHDVLSPSDRLLVGHLTLIRNSPDLCRLYRECPNYLQILCQDSHEGFDEKGFHRLVMHLASVNKLRVFLRDMKQEDILLRLNGRSGFLVIWRRGRLYDVAAFREICHFHFMESKWKQMFNVESVRALDDCMILTPNSLVTVKNIPGKLRLLGLAVATIILAIPWYLRVTIRFPISRLRKSLSRMLRPLPYSQKPTDK